MCVIGLQSPHFSDERLPVMLFLQVMKVIWGHSPEISHENSELKGTERNAGRNVKIFKTSMQSKIESSRPLLGFCWTTMTQGEQFEEIHN